MCRLKVGDASRVMTGILMGVLRAYTKRDPYNETNRQKKTHKCTSCHYFVKRSPVYAGKEPFDRNEPCVYRKRAPYIWGKSPVIVGDEPCVYRNGALCM